MSGRRVLVIRLQPLVSEIGRAELRCWIKQEADAGAHITILASTASKPLFETMPVVIWPDGVPRGALRLLELMRRLSWGQFATIYDLDGRGRSLWYRWLVRPCPPWHRIVAFRHY